MCGYNQLARTPMTPAAPGNVFFNNFFFIMFIVSAQIIVLRSSPVVGPVQNLDSGFWPDHQVLIWSLGIDRIAGSAGSILFFLKKSKRRRFSKRKTKKKVNGFEAGSCRVNRVAGSYQVFPSFIFSLTRPGSGPGSARWAGPGFKTMAQIIK